MQEVDDVIRQLQAERGVDVLSFCEGAPTAVMMSLPQMLVVPEASAYPGYGRQVVLHGVDHINACKPAAREAPAYIETLKFARKVLDRVRTTAVSEEAVCRT